MSATTAIMAGPRFSFSAVVVYRGAGAHLGEVMATGFCRKTARSGFHLGGVDTGHAVATLCLIDTDEPGDRDALRCGT